MISQNGTTSSTHPPRLNQSPVIFAVLLVWPIMLSRLNGTSITAVYFLHEDLFLFAALIAMLIAVTIRAARWRLPDLKLSYGRVIAGAGLLALALWLGTYAVMSNYALTRDEHMVLFDMAVFAKGHLIEPMAVQWRANPKAVVPDFLLDVPGHAAVVSAYLPVNAMLRLTFAKVADPALLNPLLAGLGGVALYDIARRTIGDDRRAVLVTLIVFAGSAQLLVNAMTVYAMTGHTALNLVWLALFLRGGKAGHGAAILTGFLAMGLHQVVFHPLFAGPFVLWLLSQRRYRLFAIYAAAITIGGLFWTFYPSVLIRASGIASSGGASDQASFVRDRVMPLLLHRDPFTIILMTLNLVRFFVWQHLALIPLLIASWPLVRRNQGIALPLAGGIVLTLGFCALILPMQGHGWGYRYLAAPLGSFALLAGVGYRHWAQTDRAAADGVFLTLTAATAVITLVLLVTTERFVAPYVALDRQIAAVKADMVLIDTEAPGLAIDQARNLPDLSNRPLRLSSRALSSADLRALCRTGSIALITRRDMHEAGFVTDLHAGSPLFEMKVMIGLAGQTCPVRPRTHRHIPD